MFGGDWCGWCHKLHELFASDAEIRKILSYEYVLVMVDTEAQTPPKLVQEVQGGSEQGRARKASAFRSWACSTPMARSSRLRGPTLSKTATITIPVASRSS